MKDSTTEDAITAIVKQAKERQIVILNEAHHIPLHRAFAMKLARELRKIGYEYLACETFNPAPLANGYVTALTGYYSREPMYVNFYVMRKKTSGNLSHMRHMSMNLHCQGMNDYAYVK